MIWDDHQEDTCSGLIWEHQLITWKHYLHHWEWESWWNAANVGHQNDYRRWEHHDRCLQKGDTQGPLPTVVITSSSISKTQCPFIAVSQMWNHHHWAWGGEETIREGVDQVGPEGMWTWEFSEWALRQGKQQDHRQERERERGGGKRGDIITKEQRKYVIIPYCKGGCTKDMRLVCTQSGGYMLRQVLVTPKWPNQTRWKVWCSIQCEVWHLWWGVCGRNRKTAEYKNEGA